MMHHGPVTGTRRLIVLKFQGGFPTGKYQSWEQSVVGFSAGLPTSIATGFMRGDTDCQNVS